jgi:hypothetical protein
MATTATLKKLFWSTDSHVSLVEAREKNAQIGDEVIVDGVPVYQDGNGAPVEQVSPLGYHVGWAGILFLNVSQMVGTGVFSTREYFPERYQPVQACHDLIFCSWIDPEGVGQRGSELDLLGDWSHYCSGYDQHILLFPMS